MTDLLLREIWFGRVWRANAVRLVEEGDDELVVYSPPGAPAKFAAADGLEVRIPRPGVQLADRVARQQSLVLVRPGARHSLWLFWTADWEFLHWYVNLERDVRRTRLGVDYVDEKLDLVVSPDGGVRLKDEDELARAAALGLLDEAEVRAEADRVLADPPWPTGWESWRPDPAWAVPQLPDGWNVV